MQMFVILPLLRWLAQHDKARVIVGVGALLFVGGLGVSAAAISSHQPMITRVGFFLLIIAILYVVVAVCGRRSRGRDK